MYHVWVPVRHVLSQKETGLKNVLTFRQPFNDEMPVLVAPGFAGDDQQRRCGDGKVFLTVLLDVSHSAGLTATNAHTTTSLLSIYALSGQRRQSAECRLQQQTAAHIQAPCHQRYTVLCRSYPYRWSGTRK